MSLHKFAEQVASQGRGDDSLLVHMTPDEVRNLQQFAQANGTTLTINPTTGLPEAGLLSDLFKSIAPIALGAFLGPAGFGMSSMMAGLTTGGITTLATGSLSRGLMAGLGAYGGSGLADSFMNAGANTVGNVAGALGVEGAATGAGSQAAMLATQNAGFGAEGLSSLANSAGVAAGATPVVPSTSSLLSSGFKAATANPAAMGTFAKQNLANIGMAAAPIMAGMMVPTTTKLNTPENTGYIRQMAYNINPDTGRPDPLYGKREMAPVKASEFGDKTFKGQRDLFYQQNPNPYNIGVASLNQPPQQQQQPNPMATGGIVALARGGVAHFDGGGNTLDNYDYAPAGGGDNNYSVREDGSVDYFANQFAPDVSAPVATPTATDSALAAYQAGDYTTASQLLAGAGMNAQDVVNTYGLGQADAATVAQNLGYTGDMSDIQYTAAPTAVSTPAVSTPVVTTPVATTPTGIETLTAATPTVTTPTQQDTGIQTLTTPVTTATTTPAATTAATTTPYYFQVNPDVAAEYAKNNQGFTTPEAYAQAHYNNFGKKEGREFAPSAAASYAAANNQNLVTNTQKWIEENPFATKQQIEDVIKASGMSQGDVQRSLDALVAKGELSAAERYWILNTNTGLAGLAANNMQWLKEHPNATQAEIDKVIKAAGLDRDSALLPLTHGFQVAEDKTNTAAALSYLADPQNKDVVAWLKSDQGKAYLKDHPEFDAKDIAWTHYTRYGIKEGRQWGVAPPDVKPPVVPPVVVPPPFTSVVPGGTQLPGATVYNNGAYGNYGSGPATGVDYLGNTVSIATPGDIISNPDGTRTVVPNVPGRPYGGFTGAEQLRSRYTAGGGKLGYTSPVQKDPATYYNKLTDGSLDAYNYLMGKGKNLTQRKPTADRPVMQRYDEAILGRKTTKPVRTTTTTKTDTKETVAGDTAVVGGVNFDLTDPTKAPAEDNNGPWSWDMGSKRWVQYGKFADGGIIGYAVGGGLGSLGSYSDGGRLLRGPGDGVSDSIPATIGAKNQPARLADGEFVIPARIVSELGNGSTDAGAKKLYAMMDRVQRARGKTTGKNKVAANSRSDKYLPA